MEQELKVDKNKVCLIIIGMAGSGKTTFVQKLSQKLLLSKETEASILINLDPAVSYLPYTPNIDIRNKIDYKKLMKQQELGPNGAILTSLNLYCAQIDTMINSLQENKDLSNFIVVDTPGQIEVFTWSASGMIITQGLCQSFPTVILYILDLAKCQDPNSFMSNMLFCCSIFYKMKLPMIVVFNKEDVADKCKVLEWMRDYEKFQLALSEQKNYLATFSKQLVLSLDDFYNNLNVVSVSSVSGSGFDDLFPAIEKAKAEYWEITYQDLVNKMHQNDEEQNKKMKQEMMRFKQDFQKDQQQDKKQKDNQMESEPNPIQNSQEQQQLQQELNECKQNIKNININKDSSLQ